MDETDIESLRGTLQSLQRVLYGGNYEVTLAADVLSNVQDESSLRHSLLAIYPESDALNAKLELVNREIFHNEVCTNLLYPGDGNAGPMFTPERRDQVSQKLIPTLWHEFDNVLPQAEIWRYESWQGLPGYPVFWNFAFVLTEKNRLVGIVFSGAASD